MIFIYEGVMERKTFCTVCFGMDTNVEDLLLSIN